MLYAIALVEDKRMRFQGLDTAFVLVLVLAALSACATSQPVTQSQPTTDASMPGMNHGAMSQPSSQAQPTSPANMSGMQQVPAAQTEDGHTMRPSMEATHLRQPPTRAAINPWSRSSSTV